MTAIFIAVAAALIVVLVLASVGRLMVDVRVHRAAEARVRASETALKEAQQLAQLGSWSWDLTSGEVTWSQELYRILGCGGLVCGWHWTTLAPATGP